MFKKFFTSGKEALLEHTLQMLVDEIESLKKEVEELKTFKNTAALYLGFTANSIDKLKKS